MQKLMMSIEKKLVKPFENISRQKHLAAVRDSLVAVFPLTFIGSIFLLITTLPLPEGWAVQQFIATHAQTILIPYRLTVVMVTLYMVVGVGANLAGYYHYRRLSGSIVAMVCFLMTQMPVNPASMVPPGFLTDAAGLGLDTSWMQGIESLGWVLPQMPMSGTGLYIGALSAIVGVEVLHFCNWLSRKRKKARKKEKIKLPDWMLQTFETILPTLLIILLMFVVRDVLGFDFHSIVLWLFSDLIQSVNSLPGAVLFSILMSLLCFFGLVGFGVSGSAASVTWMLLLGMNTAAHSVGGVMPNVVTLPFFHFFVWFGGHGMTLCLVVLACFSKSALLKRLGIGCLFPSLLNSNSPMLFGLPLILNTYFFIPLIVGSVLTTLTSYFAFHVGLVAKTYLNASGTLPFFAGAYLSTGDWKAILLSCANFILMTVVYYPFFKMYEKKVIHLEQQSILSMKPGTEEIIHVTKVEE